MNKKLTRTLAGAMSLMFMGQVMIFGDGSAQGLLHADTIASAAEVIEGAKNKDQLAKEFEEATKDLGKVDFFDVADEKEHHVYHIRAIVVMTIEAVAAILLFVFHFKQFVLVLEIAWCSLAVMLLLGKGKNVFENKKGGCA